MNIILEAGQGMNISSLFIVGIILLAFILAPIVTTIKNRKNISTAQKMLDELKKGDEVMTASGVIGKIVSIDTKVGYKTVTIETGDSKHKGYITLDINAIYMNLSATPQNVAVAKQKEEPKAEEKPVEEVKTEETESVEEKKEETKEPKAE